MDKKVVEINGKLFDAIIMFCNKKVERKKVLAIINKRDKIKHSNGINPQFRGIA